MKLLVVLALALAAAEAYHVKSVVLPVGADIAFKGYTPDETSLYISQLANHRNFFPYEKIFKSFGYNPLVEKAVQRDFVNYNGYYPEVEEAVTKSFYPKAFPYEKVYKSYGVNPIVEKTIARDLYNNAGFYPEVEEAVTKSFYPKALPYEKVYKSYGVNPIVEKTIARDLYNNAGYYPEIEEFNRFEKFGYPVYADGYFPTRSFDSFGYPATFKSNYFPYSSYYNYAK